MLLVILINVVSTIDIKILIGMLWKCIIFLITFILIRTYAGRYKTKFMDKERNAVRKMVKKLPVYIFEDTPILSSLDVISHMFYGGKYSYIRRENDSIVIFQKKSILLFANIISRAEKVLDRELKRFNIEYTNVNKIGNIDEIFQ